MMERRKERRRRCFLGGELEFEHGRSPVDCLVRNVGEAGALIAVDEALTLPVEFELYVAHWRRRFRATPVWSSVAQHGVALTSVTSKVIPLEHARRTWTPDA